MNKKIIIYILASFIVLGIIFFISNTILKENITIDFSIKSGFYKDEFDVEILGEEGVKIYYTIDGTKPTKNSAVYSEPIHVYDRSEEANVYRSMQKVVYNWKDYIVDETPVEKAFIIRAIAIGKNGAQSEEINATYFIGIEKEKAVISIIADKEDLYGDYGIYSTGKKYDEWYLNDGNPENKPKANFDNRDLDCLCYIEVFDEGGDTSLKQKAGLKINGHSARRGAIKRLAIYAKKKYCGSRIFEEQIFDGIDSHSLILREGDSNSICMDLINDRNTAALKTRAVEVFLNGEYWYTGYFSERYDDEYFDNYYGVSNVTVCETELQTDITEYIYNHDLSIKENYDGLNEILDIQSYIDYYCANIYLGNTDYSEDSNLKIWKSNSKSDTEYNDGRWRMALYDLDMLTNWCIIEYKLKNTTPAQLNSFEVVRPWAKAPGERLIFSNLLKNNEFRKQFVITFMDMVNTCFTIENIEAVLEDHNFDLTYYYGFYKDRTKYIVPYLAEYFGLTGTLESINLSTNEVGGGTIKLNTCTPDLSTGEWSGQYYTDYEVILEAVPNEGYTFIGWEGTVNSNDSKITVELIENGIELVAVFEKQ